LATKDEKNSNNILISKGAIPVDLTGKIIEADNISQSSIPKQEVKQDDSKKQDYPDEELVEKIIQELISRNGKGITVNEIIDLFHLKKKDSTILNKLLSENPNLIKSMKGRANYYLLKRQLPQQTSIF
jgi:hypothetical protein